MVVLLVVGALVGLVVLLGGLVVVLILGGLLVLGKAKAGFGVLRSTLAAPSRPLQRLSVQTQAMMLASSTGAGTH